MQRQVDDAELAVHEIDLFGPLEERVDVGRRHLAALDAAFGQVILDSVRDRPGVLVVEGELERERPGRRGDGVGREHVETIDPERCHVADAQETERAPLRRLLRE